MRILIISHEFPPAGGGAATACASFAKYLARDGIEIEVITSRLANSPQIEEIDNYTVKRVLSFRTSLYTGTILEVSIFLIHGFFYFLRGFKDRGPDIVYCFFSLPAGMVGLFIKLIYKVPYYVFLRGMDVPGFCGGEFSFWNRVLVPIIKYIWIKADRIIANSQALRKLASETLKNKEIKVLSNGIDTDFFTPMERAQKSDKIKILFVGRLKEYKGVSYLLDAMKILLGNIHNCLILEIVGEGPAKNALIKRSLRLGIADRITFSGWCSRADIKRKYQEADIFVNLSLDEGMPNTVLEAMACGLPIIASDIPPHRELIEHGKNGLLTLVNDSRALAENLEYLIKEDDVRVKLKEEGLKRIQDYDLRIVYQEFRILNKYSC